LIDNPDVAGQKAFDWQKEFSTVFAKGGFDVVLGNPPYIRAEHLGHIKDILQANYKVYHSASDIFSYFYELGLDIVKKNQGVLAYISNTFDKTAAGAILREYIQSQTQIVQYVDLTEVKIFQNVTTYPVILILKDTATSNEFVYKKIPKKLQSDVIPIDSVKAELISQANLESQSWSFINTKLYKVLKRMEKFKTVREQYGKCYYGIKTGLNEAFIINKSKAVDSDHIIPVYEGKEITKWSTIKATQALILFKSKWTNDKYGREIIEEELQKSLTREFPEIMSKLLPYEEKARKRYDKGDYWWEMRNCAYYDLFDHPKIIFPNLQNDNKFSFDRSGAYLNAPAVFLPADDKTLLCVLNSRLAWSFLKSICVVRSGGYIEVKPQYFEQIPVPDLSQVDLKSLADNVINTTSQFQETVSTLLNLLSSKFSVNKPSRKLQSWYSLTFQEFLSEMKKQKIKLSLSDQAEWMTFFEEQKSVALKLKSEIKNREDEINLEIYRLYGLSEEEIRVVEDSFL